VLHNPHAGWETIRIGNFEDRASYLTNVPIDILDALINSYRKYKPAVIKFDAEGWEYIVVIDDYRVHIIDYKYRNDDEYLNSDDDEQVLTTIVRSKDDIAKEVISDIERDYDKWLNWMYFDTEKDIAEQKVRLDSKLNALKKWVSKY